MHEFSSNAGKWACKPLLADYEDLLPDIRICFLITTIAAWSDEFPSKASKWAISPFKFLAE